VSVNIDDIIAGAKLPETTVPICLRGDLQAEFEDLERQLNAAREADTADSLAAGGHARKIAQQIEALGAQMREHEVTFRFRALPQRAYSDLTDEHPPRKDRKDKDDEFDVNWDTFPTALIAACAIEPTITEAKAERLRDVITHQQWDDLFAGAFSVNRSKISVPKSVAASAILAATEPKSKPRGRGASRGGGSSAGNPSA
jgi:hypothetical protein